MSGASYTNSVTKLLATDGDIIMTIPDSSGSTVIFEYWVRKDVDNYFRAGMVISTWLGSVVVFTDTSTPDGNGSTSEFRWVVNISGGNIELTTDIDSGSWDVKVYARIIF
jgi:predicted carbohydrate-binding protein with CBM5 and CBM33 domain